MPTEQDTAEVNAKDAKARYMEQQNVQILAEEQERLRQCIIGMSEPYLKDTIDSFARIVMTSSQLSEATRKYLAYTLQHCAAVIDNVQKGHAMGVDYGTQNARPFSGDSDSVDSGARGISITDGSSPSSTVSK
jgi:hypothetical protein